MTEREENPPLTSVISLQRNILTITFPGLLTPTHLTTPIVIPHWLPGGRRR
jgi:hypothetical protein